MNPRAYIVTESASRYSLLGAFGMQFGSAMQRCGLEVNPDAGGPEAWGKPGRAAFVFFNHLNSVEETYGWAGGPEKDRAVVQWCVDHPLTIEADWLDRMSRDPGFRLLTVTSDDAHLLSLRFPQLRHATVWHGVDESALCAAEGIEQSHAAERDIDVIIAGSIASSAEIAQLKARIPAVLHGACDEIAALRVEHPGMSFGQAMDVAMPSGVRASDHWTMMRMVFAYVTAVVGRTRRVAAAQAMQGLNTVLIGTEAWKEFATGTLKFGGMVGYGELPGWLMRSKVCLAVSPPQFVTGFSERVLLSMAAGCATVAEGRVAIEREFGASGGVQMYAPDRAELARVMVGKLLDDAAGRTRMGIAGRGVIAAGHLWGHRVAAVMAAAGMVEREPARAAA
jgi:hypothetical protein